MKAGYHTGESLTTWGRGREGRGCWSAEPGPAEDVGPTKARQTGIQNSLSKDSWPRSHRSGVEKRRRNAPGHKWWQGGVGGVGGHYYWVGKIYTFANFKGSASLLCPRRRTRATIFFSSILTCDFSVPECINSRRLFNY